LDIFSGSNTTGEVAEELGRKWLSIELDRKYAALSAVRFMREWEEPVMRAAVEKLENGQFTVLNAQTVASLDGGEDAPIIIGPKQTGLFVE